MQKSLKVNPFSLPIIFFGAVIAIGAFLLKLPMSSTAAPLPLIDALFTATSATCVTGLAVVDTGSRFTPFGQSVILGLIQLGGLGIMTYTTLIFYLWNRKVSLTDRLAVGQSLMHDPGFHLGKFLTRIVIWTMIMEGAAAAALYVLDPNGFKPFSALFHAVSAYCNAGFSLDADSLVAYRGIWPINLIFMVLIISGGIGFSVMMEMLQLFKNRLRRLFQPRPIRRLSGYSRLVIHTTLFLIIAGAVGIYAAEFVGYHRHLSFNEAILSSLFQSVTCRTAGFNTLPIGELTNVTLVIMTGLMIIGGAPGSCAGGIKVTTFRIVIAHAVSQFVGREQTVVARTAVDRTSLNRALMLVFFAGMIIGAAVLALNITEGGDIPHPQTRGLFFDIFFEVISAFGTVGLSTGLTPTLSWAGKTIIAAVMFIGRLGPIVFVAAIQSHQRPEHFRWPEKSVLVG
jgi:trk system potassium uptake protein